MTVEFEVPGPPVGKGRPRFARAGNYVRTFTPEKTASYENLVKLMYKTQCGGKMLGDGPLGMLIIAYYQIPQSASKKKKANMLEGRELPTVKPDSSNVLKSIEDALNCIAYPDDKQIIDTRVLRLYGEHPHVYVSIWETVKDGTLKKQAEGYQNAKIGE